jgi:branched-chain amino acid transport system substrate-binding protein
LRRLKIAAVTCVATAALVAGAVATGPAGAQSTTTGATSSGKNTLYVIGAYETKGESSQAVPNFEDGAQLAVKDLQKKGWTVKYERVPASGTIASSQEQAFLAAQAKNPDFWIGLTSSNVFIPVGPKVAATDLPSFALASPTEGVRNGPSGGDNVYLLRPLNEQTYAKLADYACGTLKLKKLGLSLVQTSFGPTAQTAINNTLKDYPNCKVVSVQTNSATASDTTQQVLAFKDAGVDGVISANFPNPMGVQVNQMRQNGLTVPYLGGASLNIAKDANAITTGLDNLYVIDDCVPDLGKTKTEKSFTKLYQSTYGYPPNYASAQVYDAFHMGANAIEKAGSHDYLKINKAMAATVYDGVCDYKIDKNNVLANSVTIYKYNTDGSKKLLKVYPLDYVPSDELATTTTAKPAG